MAIRKGRNSIPAVNPNPRPPNEPKYGLRNNQPANSKVGLQGNKGLPQPKPGKGPNTGKKGQQGQGGNPAPAPLPAAFSPGSPAVDPRDAEYWRNQAILEFNRTQGVRNLDTEDVFERTSYERDKANREYLNPIEIRKLKENANTEGAIYSTATQEDLGNLGQQQFQQLSGITEAYQRALAMRANQRKGLQEEYDLGGRNLYSEAIERQAGRELERPGPEEIITTPAQAQKAAMKKKTQKKPQNKKPQSKKPVQNAPLPASKAKPIKKKKK